MKKNLFLTSLILTVFLYGCEKEVSVAEPLPKETKTEAVEKVLNIAMKPCPEAIMGLKLSYPPDIEECVIKKEEEVWFSKEYKGETVSLVASLKKINKYQANNDRVDFFSKEGGSPIIHGNIKIFPTACGGGHGCYGLIINDSFFYEISFDIKSTQPIPEFLTYKWTPDHDFTQEDMLNIITSVEQVEK